MRNKPEIRIRLTLAALLCWMPVRADIVYLKNGNEMEVEEVLYEKNGTLYFKRGGKSVVGIPASLVERWERSTGPEGRSKEQGPPVPKETPQEEPSRESGALAPLSFSPLPKVEAEPIPLSKTYSVEDMIKLEKAFAGPPQSTRLRRALALAHSQTAVEKFLTGDDEGYRYHIARARMLASRDAALDLISKVHDALKNGRPNEAAESIKFAKDPASSDDYRLLLLEGKVAYERGELELVQRVWEEALRLKPSFRELEAALKELRPRSRIQKDFERKVGGGFIMQYDKKVDGFTARDIKRILEEAYDEVTLALDTYPDEPIQVLVYVDADFETVTGLPVDYAEGVYDGKIRIPLKAILKRPEKLPSIFAHETAHAVIHLKSRGGASRWLHEGIAQFLQGGASGRPYAKPYLEHYRSPDVEPEPGDYHSALLWIEFLEETFGFASINKLLDALGTGTPETQAYPQVLGLSKKELADMWLPYLEEIASNYHGNY